MPWVRLDDQFPDHPKIVRAGPSAAWLYVCGLAYCARHLTDGLIPEAQMPRLMTGAAKLADRLVAAGLWEVTDDGYRVHDFLNYNPSRAQTLAKREIRASAGARGGKQKASNLLAASQADATTMRVANGYPVPVPLPHVATEAKASVGDVPSQPAVRPAPKPSDEAAARSLHQKLFQALSERFGLPANDAERGRYARAAKLLGQAKVEPYEVFALADAAEDRWPEAECTPLAIAHNVTTLRAPARPKTNGHAPPSKSARNFEILRDLAKEMIDDDSPGDAPLGLPAGRVPDAGRRGVHAEDLPRLPLRRPLA